MNRLTIKNAFKSLKSEKELFKLLFNHGSLSIEIYQPNIIDVHKFHSRDGLYFIASDSRFFVNGDSRESYEQEEELCFPAGFIRQIQFL